MKNILLIDHDDSFTYNIKTWLEDGGLFYVTVQHWKNLDMGVSDLVERYDLVVFSPGPGHPQAYGRSMDLMRKLTVRIPVFGVCLGMQLMLEILGLETETRLPVHGKQTMIKTSQTGLFEGIQSLTVGRYHSLGFQDVQGKIHATAWADDGTIMAVRDNQKKLMGVQFHPESFLTEKSALMRDNLFNWVNS